MQCHLSFDDARRSAGIGWRVFSGRAGRVIACVWTALGLLGGAWAAEAPQAPALTIASDHPDGVYAPGQPIRWRVEPISPSRFTEATYTLKKGGLVLLREGKLSLASTVEEIEAALPEPGTLLLEVKATDREGHPARALGGAAVAPEQIQPAAPRPADFDAFWQAKLEELAKTPAQPQLTPGDAEKPGVDYWQITMDNIRGTHIRGQLARPKAGDKLPAMLIVQWAGVYGLAKSWATEPATAGWLVLNINAHDLPINEARDFYDKQSQGPLQDYPAIGNDDRDKSYFLRMYLSCYRAAQYLAERPDWNGQTLLVRGTSQGGLQTLMIAGLHPKITAAIACVPAGCDLNGPQAGRSPGWPCWCWKAQGKDPAKVVEACRYYDVVNFASRIRCPVLVGAGLIDETCPPAGILAALNQAKAPKEIVLLPRGDHQGTYNSHQTFLDRAQVWQDELRQGKPAPVKNGH